MIINAKDWTRPILKVDQNLSEKVSEILSTIKFKGDSAINDYALKFDQQAVKIIELKPFDEYKLDNDLAESIKFSAKRIGKFARFQMKNCQSDSYEDEHGSFGQIVKPIERVGAYIPGGRYPLISTALMTLIPSKVAGSPVRIACSPSNHTAILAAASLAGATQFIQVGGVQAIASLAFGIFDNDPVDVIVGPGNAWVNEAKKQIQSFIKIDGLAGPSELLALCDGEQPVEWLALDALAQAEHDPLACSLIVSDDEGWLTKMLRFLESQSETKNLLKKKQIELIFAESTSELIDFSNSYAAEHLMFCHKNIKPEQLTNYGSLFVGKNSAVALGDYITGPNHTLPTLGYARQNGGLNVNTFLRVLTSQTINDIGRKQLSNMAMPIAKAEGLEYHFKSLQARL
ncbi:MAG: histidinol dehydrogenase [Kangiella sp.]|nr:MAG: histidinol dehydrogenase [Kangiella sp.]